MRFVTLSGDYSWRILRLIYVPCLCTDAEIRCKLQRSIHSLSASPCCMLAWRYYGRINSHYAYYTHATPWVRKWRHTSYDIFIKILTDFKRFFTVIFYRKHKLCSKAISKIRSNHTTSMSQMVTNVGTLLCPIFWGTMLMKTNTPEN